MVARREGARNPPRRATTVTVGQSGVVTDGLARVPSTGRLDLVRFAAGTGVLLGGVVVAVLAALPVSGIVTYLLTAGITGWRDPGPEIIQGCEKSLTCAESGTFFPIWGFALLAYAIAMVRAFRAVLNRVPPDQRRHHG